MKIKKSLNSILCVLLCGIMLASCGAQPNETPSTTMTVTVTEADVTTVTELAPDIPDMINLNGETITILYRAEFIDEFDTEEKLGEPVNDAIWTRNNAVEEKFNCTLNYYPNTNTDYNGGYQKVITTNILADSNAFDIISGSSYHIPSLIVDGYLYNLRDIDYLDFSKPWWVQSLIEMTSFGDKLYLVSGDISLGMIKYIHCTYFNKRLCEDYNIEDLYDLVLDGKWTVEKMEELFKGKYLDLNGNSQVDSADDQFGYIIPNSSLWRGYIDALGVKYMYINDEGYPEFNFADQRTFDV